MEREIKFRGLSVDGKGWICGSLILPNTENGNTYIQDSNGSGRKVIPETVGQFTGEKDVKGVEIYEDDIIMHGKESTYNPNPIHVVEFALGAFYMQNRNTLGELEFNNLDRLDIEVIGNIHEK